MRSTGLRHRFYLKVSTGLALAFAMLALVGPERVQAAPLPTGFSDGVVLNGLTQPTAVRFASDGRVFVAEKSGLIKVFDSLSDPTADVFANLNAQVYNFWDRGLLGLALDPNFPASPYVYVAYTHDAVIGGIAPRWGTPGVLSDPCPSPPGATADGCVVSGRVSRLTASGNSMTGAEQVLVEDWCQQFPSHTVGSLAFGADGALYVSGGDGASFFFADYGQNGNPCGDPPSEGGALRSQDIRTSGDPAGLGGTIIRIDPATGAALPDNPRSTSPDPNERRIVASGFRNPFRFALKPGTNELWVGDVGWSEHEEIDIVNPTQVENFGWPCYEGAARHSSYDGLNLSLCENLYATPSAVKQPHFTYRHRNPAFPGDTCANGNGSSGAGVAFYQGGTYPSRYSGAVFFADYSRDCISVLIGGSASAPEEFATNALNPVDLQIGPGGDVYYVDFDGGTVHRITFAGQPPPPPTGAYVSDLAWGSSSNGWGPIERDRSNGELGAADGGPLRLNGTTFAKGLGVHAPSELVLPLSGCSAFRATVGVDDEVGSQGAVRFQVFGDGVKLWESAVLTGTSAPLPVDVNVTGRSSLRLVVDGAGPEDYDHADWADARIVCSAADTTAPTVTSVSPANGATGVSQSVRPAAVFSEPLAAGSVTTSTFTLRKQGASVDTAGSVAYDGVTRTVTLTPTVPLDAGASYTARLVGGAAGVKDVAGNPLAADHTWTFTVAAAADTTAPTVTSVSPASGATGVSQSVRPAAVFSEPLAVGSVTTSTFTLRKQGASVDTAGSVAYDGATRTVTLTPAAVLDAGASYTARVVGGASGVKDVAGNPLAADHTWTFTVAAAPNTAPMPVIAAPVAGTTWAVGDSISFSGSATDPQDGTLAPSRLSWALILHHCGGAGCHTHPIQSFEGVAGGSFTTPDHEYPSHLELRLTATDSAGLAAVVSRQLDPRAVDLTFQTVPVGLSLVVGSSAAATPFTRTAIVGSQNVVGATSPQTIGGQPYVFSTWSDGGSQSHTVIAPSASTTYTATFTPSSGTTTTTFVSDMTWVSSTNDWGPVERDQSNGEALAGDGAPLRLNGVVFAKGLGTHAASDLVVALGGSCSSFKATVGVDDEVGSAGSVRFQVLGDGVLLWESAVLTGASVSVPVDVNVSGRSSLRLVVTNGGNNEDFDHADWAEARVTCSTSDTTAPTVSSVTPAAGATGVSPSVRPTATFSEPMSSVTAATFTLRKAGASSDVAASVAYDAVTRTATLTPAASLDAGGSYTARVLGGAAGVRDAAGNPLAADHTWTFTVATGPVRAFPSSVVRETGTAAGGDAASLAADDNNYYLVNSTTTGTRTTSWYGVISNVPNSLTALSATYRGANSATCTQTVGIWRWTTSAWVTLATRSSGTTEFTHAGLVPTGALADYVSGTTGNGEVRVRVRCTRTGNFTSRGELLFVDYTP